MFKASATITKPSPNPNPNPKLNPDPNTDPNPNPNPNLRPRGVEPYAAELLASARRDELDPQGFTGFIGVESLPSEGFGPQTIRYQNRHRGSRGGA